MNPKFEHDSMLGGCERPPERGRKLWAPAASRAIFQSTLWSPATQNGSGFLPPPPPAYRCLAGPSSAPSLRACP